MRISDWSSDVCSSDLQLQRHGRGTGFRKEPRQGFGLHLRAGNPGRTRFRTGGTGKVIFRSHWERAVRLGGTAAWSQRERGLGLPVGQKPLTKTAGGSLRAAAGPLNLKQDKALAQRPALEIGRAHV